VALSPPEHAPRRTLQESTVAIPADSAAWIGRELASGQYRVEA
jgi:hypothetical protein